MRRATNIQRKKLVSLGVCFGKFTKTKKFKLHITSLDILAQYARVRFCAPHFFDFSSRPFSLFVGCSTRSG
jgi:hypothetical protein